MLKRLFLSLLLLTAILNATTPTQENVTKLYVAMFERAPDAAGLDYWIKDSGLDLEGIAQSFFAQEETQKKYPPGTTAEVFVNTVYDNLFNRPPDTAGLEYWKKELESGNIPRSLFVLAVINGAQGNDAKILDNKTEVGLAFAKAGLDDAEDAKCVMVGITEDPATVVASMARIKGLTEGIPCTPPSPPLSYTTLKDLEFTTLNIAENWKGGAGTTHTTMVFSNRYSDSREGLIDDTSSSLYAKACAVTKGQGITYVCVGLFSSGEAAGWGINIDSARNITGNFEYSPTGDMNELVLGITNPNYSDASVSGKAHSNAVATNDKMASVNVVVANKSNETNIGQYVELDSMVQSPQDTMGTIQIDAELVQKLEDMYNTLQQEALEK